MRSKGKSPPKKRFRVLRQRTTVEDFYRLVQTKDAQLPVQCMCRRLGISRASYYRWLDAEESPPLLRHLVLTERMKMMFDSSYGIGHRMVHTKLAADGIQVSVGTVTAIMAENGWVAKRMRAFKRTTVPSDPERVFEHVIGRDFT